jgi:dCMP deaminase
MSERLGWDSYFINLAKYIALRSTCDRLSVGCVIVKDNRVIGTGYNGSVSGLGHCGEVGHLYNDQGRCIRTVHAEQNALLTADKTLLKGSTAYVTHYPCEICSKLLVQAGISRVVYLEPYENKHSKYFLDTIITEQITLP